MNIATPNIMPEPPPMSAAEARKLLGKGSEQLSDEDIECALVLLDKIAHESIKYFGSKIIH